MSLIVRCFVKHIIGQRVTGNWKDQTIKIKSGDLIMAEERKEQIYKPTTIKELLNWSYANLAAYQTALAQNPPAYIRSCWMVRARLFKGLQTGSMSRQSIYNNEREKLKTKDVCSYCGATGVPLTLDHLFAKAKNGCDSGDNFVYCCKSCNSSKRDMDYFQWVEKTGREINPAVAARYLKNAYTYCEQRTILDCSLENVPDDLPFDLALIPRQYNLSKASNLQPVKQEQKQDSKTQIYIVRKGGTQSEADQSQPDIRDSIEVPNIVNPLIDNFEGCSLLCDRINEIVNVAIPEAIQKAMAPLNELSESIAKIQAQFQSVFVDIHIPSFDEEWLQERRVSYEKWGEYGWTSITWAKLKFFYTVPDTQAEADAKALSCCDEEQIEGLLTELLEKTETDKSDLTEAIDDYRSKHYKSCVCILFSLIDGILIRSMKKDKKRRPHGYIAAKKLNERIKDAEEFKGMVFHLLAWAGVLAAINSFFKDGDDFKEQPTVLGRNWLAHGMLNRPVTRKDCIQLFLLLDNLFRIKEMLRKIMV